MAWKEGGTCVVEWGFGGGRFPTLACFTALRKPHDKPMHSTVAPSENRARGQGWGNGWGRLALWIDGSGIQIPLPG
jgi:hypothetical protein